MRTVFLLLLMVFSVAAQPFWRNPWSTNVPPALITVNGANGGGITNIGANGAHYGLWHFYGNDSNTVARLDDATNIARSVVGSSNGNYVLKFNGASDNQTATNLGVKSFSYGDAFGLTNLASIGSGTVGDIPIVGVAAAPTVRDYGYDNGVFWYDFGPQTLHALNQTNSGTLDVFGPFRTYSGQNSGIGTLTFAASGLDVSGDNFLGGLSTITMQGQEVLNADTNAHKLYYANTLAYTNLQFGNITPLFWDDFIGGYPGSSGLTWGKKTDPWNSIYANGEYFISNALTVATIKAGFTNGAFWIGTLSNQLMTFWMSNNVTQFKILAP